MVLNVALRAGLAAFSGLEGYVLVSNSSALGGMPQMSEGYTYEVVLGPAALLVVVHMRTDEARSELAAALRVELEHSDNPRNHAVYDGLACYHQVLMTGHTAVLNELTASELADLGRRERRQPLEKGYYVYDLLSADAAIIRGVSRVIH